MLLDLDPDLGRGIDPQQWQQARRASLVNLVRVAPGPWKPARSLNDRDDIIALIVIEGVICRETAIGAAATLELICREDVLLPPVTDAGPEPSLTVLTPATLMVLSQRFIQTAARYPSLLTNLNRRLEAQRHRLAVQGLAVHLPRAEDRLLLILWQIAESCGRVTRDGIILPVSLSHDTLARLAAARRPTITLAFGKLEATGRITRDDNGQTLITDTGRHRIDELMTESAASTAIGAALRLEEPSALTTSRAAASR